MVLAEHQGDHVQGPIELAVPGTVEAVADDRPEEACSGAAPASMAKAASVRNRPGWDQLTSSWAAVMGADAELVEQERGDGVTSRSSSA